MKFTVGLNTKYHSFCHHIYLSRPSLAPKCAFGTAIGMLHRALVFMYQNIENKVNEFSVFKTKLQEKFILYKKQKFQSKPLSVSTTTNKTMEKWMQLKQRQKRIALFPKFLNTHT